MNETALTRVKCTKFARWHLVRFKLLYSFSPLCLAGVGVAKRVLFADSEDPDEMQHNAAISSRSTLYVKVKRSSDKIIQYFF